jgi:hypothetical protein
MAELGSRRVLGAALAAEDRAFIHDRENMLSAGDL